MSRQAEVVSAWVTDLVLGVGLGLIFYGSWEMWGQPVAMLVLGSLLVGIVATSVAARLVVARGNDVPE